MKLNAHNARPRERPFYLRQVRGKNSNQHSHPNSIEDPPALPARQPEFDVAGVCIEETSHPKRPSARQGEQGGQDRKPKTTRSVGARRCTGSYAGTSERCFGGRRERRRAELKRSTLATRSRAHDAVDTSEVRGVAGINKAPEKLCWAEFLRVGYFVSTQARAGQASCNDVGIR